MTALFEADFSSIIAHREAHKAEFAREGANLTFTAYFVAACIEAMKAVPQVNARWFEDRIEIPEDINVGIGTALGDKGLIVPVIHRAQTLSLREIAQRLTELTEKARSGELVARRRAERHVFDFQSRHFRIAARGTHHHQPAAIGDFGHRQAAETRRGA